MSNATYRAQFKAALPSSRTNTTQNKKVIKAGACTIFCVNARLSGNGLNRQRLLIALRQLDFATFFCSSVSC